MSLEGNRHYDVVIVGGGLAGLALSIQLAKANYRVLVLEKKSYPFHKVCGEYLSLESYDFLAYLGLDWSAFELPFIRILQLNSPHVSVEVSLPLGAVGISRYVLDAELAHCARRVGVNVVENCRVLAIDKVAPDRCYVQSTQGVWTGRVGVLANGKYPLPPATGGRQEDHHTGIKYHIPAYEAQASIIQLHTFKGGYLGSSHIEAGKACLCYLIEASILRRFGGDLKKVEAYIAQENPNTIDLFASRRMIGPIAVSQFYIGYRGAYQDGLFYVGDAAGMVAPLTGNGMSMALHGSYLLAQVLLAYLRGTLDLESAGRRYTKQWKKHFMHRVWVGKQLQPLMSRPLLTYRALACLRHRPLLHKIIRWTHGSRIPIPTSH